MNDNELLIRALEKFVENINRRDAERAAKEAEERKLEMERAKRRKILYDKYYKQAPRVSLSIPPNSSLWDMKDGSSEDGKKTGD